MRSMGSRSTLWSWCFFRPTRKAVPLNALACAARTLRDADVLSRVRQAADRDALYAALTAPAS